VYCSTCTIVSHRGVLFERHARGAAKLLADAPDQRLYWFRAFTLRAPADEGAEALGSVPQSISVSAARSFTASSTGSSMIASSEMGKLASVTPRAVELAIKDLALLLAVRTLPVERRRDRSHAILVELTLLLALEGGEARVTRLSCPNRR